jgi:hypothetical protein
MDDLHLLCSTLYFDGNHYPLLGPVPVGLSSLFEANFAQRMSDAENQESHYASRLAWSLWLQSRPIQLADLEKFLSVAARLIVLYYGEDFVANDNFTCILRGSSLLQEFMMIDNKVVLHLGRGNMVQILYSDVHPFFSYGSFSL